MNLLLLRQCVSSYGDPGLTCLSAGEEEEECVPYYAWCNGEEEGEPPKVACNLKKGRRFSTLFFSTGPAPS